MLTEGFDELVLNKADKSMPLLVSTTSLAESHSRNDLPSGTLER
jgi:hypothetical protein